MISLGGRGKAGHGRAGKEPRPRLRWELDRCTLCGACAPLCAYDALEVHETFLRVQRQKCQGCGDCARGCPTGALSTEGPGTNR